MKVNQSQIDQAIKRGDVKFVALLWRHQQVMHLLHRGDSSVPCPDPYSLLSQVVAPGEELLARSIKVAEELVAGRPFVPTPPRVRPISSGEECRNGHPRTKENTAIRNGARRCRVCEREGGRRRAINPVSRVKKRVTNQAYYLRKKQDPEWLAKRQEKRRAWEAKRSAAATDTSAPLKTQSSSSGKVERARRGSVSRAGSKPKRDTSSGGRRAK